MSTRFTQTVSESLFPLTTHYSPRAPDVSRLPAPDSRLPTPANRFLAMQIDFFSARARIASNVHVTPLLRSSLLGARIGCRLFLKCENLQKTGSFKVRGVLNKLSQLDDIARERGVITISAGNHAAAIAWAGAQAGISSLVVMPATASKTKVAASRAYGAEVILHGDVKTAFAKVRELERERHLTFVHPFDDEHIVAGHGSAGLEILEQAPEVDVVVVPIGGGGLISGIAAAIKARKPSVRVYGVEPEGASTMRQSLDAGHAVHVDSVKTIADGLAPPMAGELTYEIVKQYVDDVVLVSDDEIIAAMGPIYSRAKLVVEPSGAAGVAALLAGKVPVTPADVVVTVLSGGNVELSEIGRWVSGEQ